MVRARLKEVGWEPRMIRDSFDPISPAQPDAALGQESARHVSRSDDEIPQVATPQIFNPARAQQR